MKFVHKIQEVFAHQQDQLRLFLTPSSTTSSCIFPEIQILTEEE